MANKTGKTLAIWTRWCVDTTDAADWSDSFNYLYTPNVTECTGGLKAVSTMYFGMECSGREYVHIYLGEERDDE